MNPFKFKITTFTSALLALAIAIPTEAKEPTFIRYGHHPLYVGALAGYGSTDWSELTAKCNGDMACEADLLSSVPRSAGDSGITAGVTIGYEIQPHFAFEASFIRFPDTKVVFDSPINTNCYPQLNNVNGTFTSHTYVFDVIGKFMVSILGTSIRGFADAGMAVTHRHDILNTFFHINPTFGVGLDYVFAEHWMVDGEFQYIAGYDKSTLTPADDYSPFLYSLHILIAYRF